MKWIAAKVLFDHPDPELCADLVAGIFYDFGLKGVVIELAVDDSDLDWAAEAAARPVEPAVTGYFPDDDGAPGRRRTLEKELGKLQERIEFEYRVAYGKIDEEDWAESWKAFFHPEKVGRRIVVKPTWREWTAGPDDLVLEIDPGMAFGTGTHPTTALCIGLIEDHLSSGDRFLDIGTGSGILLLAAARLGAASGTGVDNDPVAVTVAEQNLCFNRIDPERFQVRTGNLAAGIDGRYDLVTANILTRVILLLLDSVADLITPGGILILSGIVEESFDVVRERMRASGFDIVEVRIREGWVALAGRFRS